MTKDAKAFMAALGAWYPVAAGELTMDLGMFDHGAVLRQQGGVDVRVQSDREGSHHDCLARRAQGGAGVMSDVNAELSSGWEPQGGIASIQAGTSVYLIQTLGRGVGNARALAADEAALT